MTDAGASAEPSDATVVSTLRDGYWDRTEIIRLGDGELCVRKASKGRRAAGPWGVSTLRREIDYLKSLRGEAARLFPPVLAVWDSDKGLGYEMAYVPDSADVAELARSRTMTQQQADTFQDALAHAVFQLLHVEAHPDQSLAGSIRQTLTLALEQLGGTPEFAAWIDTETVSGNGCSLLGARMAARELFAGPDALEAFDRPPFVRLHGDLFLENILLPRHQTGPGWPCRITLLDPVSVAGTSAGHPLFDLVKYESYATGELPAMRSEKVHIEGFDDSAAGRFIYQVCWDDPEISPYRQTDWHSRFRAAYVGKYGPVDQMLYAVLEAYFAAAMALCTTGLHRRARVLKTVLALNAALGRDGA